MTGNQIEQYNSSLIVKQRKKVVFFNIQRRLSFSESDLTVWISDCEFVIIWKDEIDEQLGRFQFLVATQNSDFVRVHLCVGGEMRLKNGEQH